MTRNAFDYNHIISSFNRTEGKWKHSLTIHGKGRSVGSIDLTDEQFSKLKNELQLTEVTSLTSDTGKAYIIK